MRLTTLFTAIAAAAVSGVTSFPFPPITNSLDLFNLIGFNLTAANNYNSPLPPWHPQSTPGWYYGSVPFAFPNIPCLNGILCEILSFFPYGLHCPVPVKKQPPPPPNDGYFQTFKNLTCATQAADFQTFGLVDTEADCLAMCNTVSGCVFVNVFLDANRNTQLTCSLFTDCHDASTADNCGGQTQEPSGLLDFIVGSDGFCKDGNKVVDPN